MKNKLTLNDSTTIKLAQRLERTSDITFEVKGEVVMRITEDGKFIAKGQEIEDVHGIYYKIMEFFTKAGKVT